MESGRSMARAVKSAGRAQQSRMFRRSAKFAAPIALASMLLAGCGASDEPNSTPTGGGAEGAIEIGVIMSLTGPFAAIGQTELRGIELAAAQVNEAGGIEGRQIELVVLDDASDP